jgi:hypothetical protein
MCRVFFLVAMLWTAAPLHAANYYVRLSGNDANAGTSAATAFRSIGRALQAAQPGDVVYVGRGTFSEAIASVRAGTASAPIRLIGDHLGTFTGDRGTPQISTTTAAAVTISHANIELERFTINGTGATGVLVTAGGVVIRSSTIRNSTQALVDVRAGTVTITGCTLHSGRDDGIRIAGGSVSISTSTIRTLPGSGIVVTGLGNAQVNRNTLYSISTWVAETDGGQLTFTNNLVRNNSNGVSISGGAASVWHNTFFSSGQNGVSIIGGTATVSNNIFTQLNTALRRTGGTLEHDANLYHLNGTNYDGTTADALDVFADPQFVNAARDWRIRNTSPAVDTGVNARNVTVTDRNGALRPLGPRFDIGAYEITGPASNLPFFTDFEGGSSTSWTSTTTTTEPALTRYLGPFTNNEVGLRLNTQPGQELVLIFDVYLRDSWDGLSPQHGPDMFNVAVDGDSVFRASYAFPAHHGHGVAISNWPDAPELQFRNIAGSGSWPDAVFRQVVVPFTAENVLTFITFFGERLSDVNDESWGIDNVRVLAANAADPFMPRFIESGRMNGLARTGSTSATGVMSADLNSDAHLDAVQVMGTTTTLSVGNSGVFSSSDIAALGHQAAVGDFNTDGRLDLIGTSAAGAETERLLLSGTTQLPSVAGAWITEPFGNEGVAAADLNNDGLLDAAYFSSNGNWSVMASALPLGLPMTGPLSSTQSAPVAITFSASRSLLPNTASDAGNGGFVSSADVNNDGLLDFFYHFNGGRLFLSNIDGTYSSSSAGISVLASDANKVGSAWADFDNDGDADLAVPNRAGAGFSLWRHPGLVQLNPNASWTLAGAFQNVASALGVSPAIGTVAAAWGDIDNDGDLDLYLTAADGQAMLYRNGGPPGFAFTLAQTEGVSTETFGGDAVFSDMNRDGAIDLLVGSQSTSYVSRMFTNTPRTQNYLAVRVLGIGRGGFNRAGVGARLELWNAANNVFLQRREVGVARGFGGQEPLTAHFGGVDPNQTYTLRAVLGRRTITVPVRPASVGTTIGSITVAQMYTLDESRFAQRARIAGWSKASRDQVQDQLDAVNARRGLPPRLRTVPNVAPLPERPIPMQQPQQPSRSNQQPKKR